MMQNFWLEALRPFSPNPILAENLYGQLAEKYGENGRFYHTLDHLQHLFDLLETVEQRLAVPEKTAVLLAIWFHDVIYDPQASDNEAQSAAWATRALTQLELPEPLIARVAQLILATATHQAPAGDLACQLLLDIDLAILGAPPARYAAYAAAIRREYRHVPDALYRNGRSAILQRLLARTPLYNTPLIRNQFAAQAKINLQNELQHLSTT